MGGGAGAALGVGDQRWDCSLGAKIQVCSYTHLLYLPTLMAKASSQWPGQELR